jgi:mannobiose 2-epimerase
VLDDRVPGIPHASPRLRTLNCLVHLGEATAAYARRAGTTPARARLTELTTLLADTTVDERFDVGIDAHDPDWAPRHDIGWRRTAVSYGHEAERVAVVGRAADVLGMPPSVVHPRLERITASQIRWGWDRLRGGVFQSGALGGPAWDPTKLWWVQAESMITYLDVHARTGAPWAGEAYLAALRWIDRSQVDWHGGEWFARIGRFGRPDHTEPKTNEWKTPFHVGRSLLLALERVDALASTSWPRPTATRPD